MDVIDGRTVDGSPFSSSATGAPRMAHCLSARSSLYQAPWCPLISSGGTYIFSEDPVFEDPRLVLPLALIMIGSVVDSDL
jgi:hypothetical protein